MLHHAGVILALAVLALGGCGQSDRAMVDAGTDRAMVDAGTDSSGGPSPENRLMPEPVDLTSATGTNVVPRLLIYKYGLAIAPELVDGLVQTARLRTWPEMDEVPATAVTGEGVYDQKPAVTVDLTPAAPLEDRWHVFVWQVPDGFDEPVRAFGVTTLADGSMGVRLRPGSHPVPVRLQLCEKQDGSTVVYVGISEPVVADAPLTDILSAGPTGAPAASCSAAQEPPPTGLDDPSLACMGLPLSAPIDVVIGPGLRSPTGAPLTALDGSPPPLAVTVDGVPPNDVKGCWSKSLP